MDLRSSARALGSDERGVVMSWLIRVLLSLALVGVLLFDFGAIVVNFFTVDSVADEVALGVVAELAAGVDPIPNLKCQRRSTVPACRQAYATARKKDVKVVSASFDAEGVFHVDVRKTASTLVIGRIGLVEDWAKATASASADTN